MWLAPVSRSVHIPGGSVNEVSAQPVSDSRTVWRVTAASLAYAAWVTDN